MIETVIGTWRGGKVELEELPVAEEGTRVIVTFLPEEKAIKDGRMITFGMFAKPGARMSTLEDFREIRDQVEKDREEKWKRLGM